MNCPCCKIPMKALVIDKVEIDECETCHGLFFDNFEIQRLDEEHEGSGEDLERILSYEAETTQRNEKVVCPRCEIKMRERRFSAACEVRVDQCGQCGGLWLDKGELGVVRRGYASEEERAKIVEDLMSGCGFDAAKKKQEAESQRKRGFGGLVHWISRS